MGATAEAELRAAISAALEQLNRERGGRYLGRVADALGVHRSSVSRWLNGEAAPSFERCMALAELYPAYFDRALLTELQTRSALGGETPPSPTMGTIRQLGRTPAEVHNVLAESLEREPAAPADREILHASLEVETTDMELTYGLAGDSVIYTAEAGRYLRALLRRAEEGWRVRLVANASTPARLAAFEALVEALEGPDVEIRGYPQAVPRVISQLVTARRDVYLAQGGPRRTPLAPTLLYLHSPEAVAWSTRYFDALFNEAPYRLRTPRGVSASEVARFRAAVEALR